MSGRMFSKQMSLYVLVFVVVVVAVVVVVVVVVPVWFCSAKFNTQPYWQDQRSSGWVAPVPKWVGRPFDEVSGLRPYHRPSRQVLCRSFVPSTELIGRIRIGLTIRSYHQPGR
jgi:hypothetical protein